MKLKKLTSYQNRKPLSIAGKKEKKEAREKSLLNDGENQLLITNFCKFVNQIMTISKIVIFQLTNHLKILIKTHPFAKKQLFIILLVLHNRVR